MIAKVFQNVSLNIKGMILILSSESV